VEIRFDENNLTSVELKDLIGTKKMIIASCRSGFRSEEDRRELLTGMIEAGVNYVDIDIDSENKFKTAILNKALERGCKVIQSYHNYLKTPDRRILSAIIRKGFDQKTDIMKIATMVRDEADITRLLSLYELPKKLQGRLLVIGMGTMGRITRIAALTLGAPFSYVSCPGQLKTAAGQFNITDMKIIFDLIKDEN
jgi:3-dehydroquinate dehydratase type I